MRVAFNKASDPFEKAIAFFSGGKWNHVELVFSDGGAFSADFRDGNVRITYEIDFTDPCWDLLDVPCTAEQEKVIREWTYTQLGLPFDFAGILHFVLPWVKADQKARFCTKAVTMALQQIGLFPGVNPEQVRPNDLYAMVKALAH